MKSICWALLILIFCGELSSQVLKGTITNSSGEPIPYSTVYIRELQQGTTSNTKGNFEIHLKEGKYTIIFQSLGFAPDIREITLGKNTVSLNIRLQVQYYEIPEVRITATGEDPAYGIMRKVIGFAPYYLNQISHYKAEVYLKGNLVINKIPKLIQRSINKDARNESGNSEKSPAIKQGDSYLMESVNELEFNAPDKYVQRVLSYQSSFPSQGNEISPMNFIEASFYQPLIGKIAISPLSPQAFSHYNFKYLGSSPQGNYIINKIQVIPKRKSQQVFDGTIFIIEDLWCLHSVDLVNENIAGRVRIQQMYIPVQEDFWMPVSHKFEIKISIIGFKADAGYGSSIKYQEVSPNTKLKKPEMIYVDSRKNTASPKPKVDTVSSKNRREIEKILSKDELSNRDMIKLSGLMEKESKKSQNDSARKSLEIKETVTHIIEKDAAKKDSSYWAEIRPIPLSEIEHRSLRTGDSLKAKLALKEAGKDTLTAKKSKETRFSRFVKEINRGHTWSDSSGLRFTFGGLIKTNKITFNPVDGFTYGIDFRISKSWKNGNAISFFPDIRYAFSRQQFMWRLNGQYRFDRMEQRQLYLRAGMTGMDFNNNGSVDVTINSITSLFLKSNYLKLYESNYLIAGFRTEITNGLYGDLSMAYDDRRILTNTSEYSFSRSSTEYTENIPDNPFLLNSIPPPNLLQTQRHYNITAAVTFTPRQKYRIRENVKIPSGSEWPTFTLSWKHIFNEFPESPSSWKQYDAIRFGVSKRKDIGAFREYYWIFRTGGYLNNSDISYFDYFHFSSQQLPVLLNNYRDAFMLPGYYSLSTPEFFTEGHIKYTTPYFLIKLLPVVSNTLIRENLSASVLWSHNQQLYTEVGYSLSQIFLMFEVGVYAGFDNYDYKSFGVKLVLKLN
jgi:hypothetical protein